MPAQVPRRRSGRRPFHTEYREWALTDSNRRPLPCKGLSSVPATWENLSNRPPARHFISRGLATLLVVLRCQVNATWTALAAVVARARVSGR